MTLWMVAYYLTPEQVEAEKGHTGGNWVIEGIFSTRDRAIAAGKAEWGWFITSLPLDEALAPGEIVVFPDFEWIEDLSDSDTPDG